MIRDARIKYMPMMEKVYFDRSFQRIHADVGRKRSARERIVKKICYYYRGSNRIRYNRRRNTLRGIWVGATDE